VTSVENPTTIGHPRTGTDAGNVAAARAALDVLLTRSGALKPAPTTLGNRQCQAQAKAPGSYVHAA
jgi:hypothetical protein